MKTKEVKITLSEEELLTLNELVNVTECYSNNLPISNDDVIKGILRFYSKAKLVNYHEQFREDIPKYIANVAMSDYLY